MFSSIGQQNVAAFFVVEPIHQYYDDGASLKKNMYRTKNNILLDWQAKKPHK